MLLLSLCQCEGRYNQKRMKLTKTLKRSEKWMTLTIPFYATFKYTTFFPLDNDHIPTPDLSAMTSTSGGSPKSEGRKKKVLEEVYLKCDKGIHMDLTKTKGQRWVGRAGREAAGSTGPPQAEEDAAAAAQMQAKQGCSGALRDSKGAWSKESLPFALKTEPRFRLCL